VDLNEQPAWLRDVFALRAEKGIDGKNRLFLEGSRLVRAALAAGAVFELAIQTPEHFGDGGSAAIVAQLAGRGVAIHRLAPAAFSKLSYKADGLIAVVRYVAPPLTAVLAAARVIALDALSDPGNIGAVVRAAGAWDASVAVIDDGKKLFHPKSLRASLGAVFSTPACMVDRAALIAQLVAAKRPIVAVVPDGEHRVDAMPLEGDPVFVVGNEKRGVHPRWLEVATARVAIPMRTSDVALDSLNVATAATVVLWESYRRTHPPAP
jgi:TrmH family RNA methyltransferase